MGRRVRWAVAALAGVMAVGALLGPAWAVPLVLCSACAVLAILYGQATGCPACGKWWSRELVRKELVAREVPDERGVAGERPVDRTTYRCAGCGHSWSVTDSESYQGPGRGRPQALGG
jgi:hypothetical protein